MLRNGLEPWHLLIVVVLFLLLFGSKKLPDTARALGKSMRILKSEAKAMKGKRACRVCSPLRLRRVCRVDRLPQVPRVPRVFRLPRSMPRPLERSPGRAPRAELLRPGKSG